MISLNPVRILKLDAQEEKGEMARLSNFAGAIAIGDLVKSTIGPKGMDKMLVSFDPSHKGRVVVTNDGATILRAVGVDNPAGKILVNMAIGVDDEVGDGTTSVTILASELLREAERMIERKIHPQTIITGYRLATKVALDTLEKNAVDHSENKEIFQDVLLNAAATALSSKILSSDKKMFSQLAVKAVLRLKGSGNINAIHIIKKKGGCLSDSFLDEGFILDKKIGQFQPKRIKNAKILIANTPMDTDKIKIFGSRVRTDSSAMVADVEQCEKEKMKDKVTKILSHKCNVFINRQLIYNYPEQLFADAGVMAIEHADFDGIERLALVTGGEIASTFDNPESIILGECDLIEEIMIGEDKLLRFSGVKLGEACTIVIRGATEQIIDEAERSLHDVICVLITIIRDKRIIYGGGAAELQMSTAISDAAINITGKESVAMEAYSKALLEIPMAISDNGGYDSSYIITALRAAHKNGERSCGIDMVNGDITDMNKLGVFESFAIKRQIIFSATEATEVILRVDHIMKAGPRPRKEDRRPC
ncbi:T-complex protein 1 subunit beta-like [Rhodnius prolixus]|uniref:T-complex protein 1 subunit beta n=1 Tax=Rhodnius prolixus TaxID=13249 RepID=R4FMG8_RHOPR